MRATSHHRAREREIIEREGEEGIEEGGEEGGAPC
jgi:hypothetical protein